MQLRPLFESLLHGRGGGWRLCSALLLGLALGCALAVGACSGSSTSALIGGDGTEGASAQLATSGAPGKAKSDVAQSIDKLTSAARPGTSSYKIGPEDVVEVSVFRVPELTKIAQVSETGLVNLPLVGEIVVANRTAQEVERDLAARLGAKYLHNPQVTVLVKEYNSQRITIEGEVKKPGVYPLRGRTTLIQAIAVAGGMEQVADTSEIIVFRQNGAQRSAARFDLDAIRGGQVRDPEIVAGDVVVVNSSALKSAFNNVVKMLPLAGVFVGLL